MSDTMASTNSRRVELGAKLFSFTSMQHWVNKASSWFAPYNSGDTICLDARGRIVTCGAHFKRAERDGTFPVTVYLVDPTYERHPLTDGAASRAMRRRRHKQRLGG